MTPKPLGSFRRNNDSLSRWESEGGALERPPEQAGGQRRARPRADRLLTPNGRVGHDKQGHGSVSNQDRTARRKRSKD